MNKYEDLGYISWSEHRERIDLDGFIVNSGPDVSVMPDDNGDAFLVICLDPLSPFGSITSRYCIPFLPYKGFHLNQARFVISKTKCDRIRMEIKVQDKKRFSESEVLTENVYGIELDLKDCYWLRIANK